MTAHGPQGQFSIYGETFAGHSCCSKAGRGLAFFAGGVIGGILMLALFAFILLPAVIGSVRFQ